MQLTSHTTDYTTEFYKHKILHASGFDDWCTSQGIGFQCTLHQNESTSLVTYVFQREDCTVGFQHKVDLTHKFQFEARVLKMLNTSRELMLKMFQLQHNFKYCDMAYPPLILDATRKSELMPLLSAHESRFGEDRIGLLKLYLSQDHLLPRRANLETYNLAFLFEGVRAAEASTGYINVVTETFNLSIKFSKPSEAKKYKYKAAELLGLIKFPMLLPPDIVNAKTVTTKFLEEVRKVYQIELHGRMYGDTTPKDSITNTVFEDIASLS